MIRLRIGLRLMLLLVAMLAVVFAWVGVTRNARRAELRWQLRDLDPMRNYPTVDEKDRKRMFGEIDAESERRRGLLGE
jgi:hypothetical protein